jgi:hypothetical protein
MENPQGTGVTNPAYFSELTAQINGIQGTGACAAIQSLVTKAMASIQAAVTAIKDQLTALLPQIAVPTDLGSAISWIKSVQAPFLKAYDDATAQLTQILSSVSALVTAIENAAGRLIGCSISIPTIS